MFEPIDFDLVDWFDVRPLFEEYGCVWVDNPEMRWYEESWGALMRQGLADATTEMEELVSKLRAVALLYMYLGFCRSLDEESDPEFYELLSALDIDVEELSVLDEKEGDTSTEEEDDLDDFEEDRLDEMKEELEQRAYETMRKEAGVIYSTLLSHYGDVKCLFVSLWNSRQPLYKAESYGEVTSDTSIEKQRAYDYVSEEMGHL